MNSLGIEAEPAPELRVPQWLANVDSPAGLKIADISAPIIYLYAFQAWCPGCHSHGFPALVAVRDGLRKRGVADQLQFIMVQTVFEGHDENTPEKAISSVEQHGLGDVPLGHDSGDPPTVMADYRTGGTPWTVLIGPDRTVLFNGFQIEPLNAVPALAHIIEEDRTNLDPR
ncbi:MAG: peroxiredoxin family protein [Acidimicrobiales bacterium]